MSSPPPNLAVLDEFRDPYYYVMVVLTWVGFIGTLVGLWALSPWFPWN